MGLLSVIALCASGVVPRAEVPALGLVVEVREGGTFVASVASGSPAATAGLAAGMQLLRSATPFPGSLSGVELSVALQRLSVPAGEPLLLTALADGRPRSVVIFRTDPIPQPEFPTVPLSAEAEARLSAIQHSRYVMELMRHQMGAPAARAEAPLEVSLDHDVIAAVDPQAGALQGVRGGGATPKWISAALRFTYRCSSPVVGLEVTGASPGLPLAIDLSQEGARGLQGSAVRRELLLWPVAEAVGACKAGRVVSLPLEVVLRCRDGAKSVKVPGQALAVRCDGKVELADTLLPNREAYADKAELLVGGPGEVTAWLFLRTAPPTPTRLTPVLVDGSGAVLKRYDAVFGRAEDALDEARLRLRLPTDKPGPVRVAFEALYADGTQALSKPATVWVRTAEEKAALDKKWQEGQDAFWAFDAKVKASGHGCRDVPAFVAWLRAQPEVERADEQPSGLSYLLKKSGLPMVFHCH